MDQLTGLRLYLSKQRDGLIALLDGLTLEEATSTPTVSDLSLFAIVKHCAFVERRWVLGVIARRTIPGIVPSENRPQEFRADPGEDLEWLRRFYADVVRDNDEVLDALTDLETPNPDRNMNPREVLLHLIEEIAQHRGQADIIRESIDGTRDVD
jgi:uncharacterized damage-inducible protein DinB